MVISALSFDAYAESVLFHIKTALSTDDAQICVAPNMALAALSAGDDVTMLFDASAVTSVTKGWGWFIFGETTPMDKAALPERERTSISEQFKVPLKEVPENYGMYLTFLKHRGVKLYINSTMLKLYKINVHDVDDALQPVDLSTMYKLFANKDKIVVY